MEWFLAVNQSSNTKYKKILRDKIPINVSSMEDTVKSDPTIRPLNSDNSWPLNSGVNLKINVTFHY